MTISLKKQGVRCISLIFYRKQYSLGDCFVGYNEDTPAAVLLETLYDLHDNADDESVSVAISTLYDQS